MVKINLIILFIISLNSCSQGNVDYQQNQGSRFSHLTKNISKKFSRNRILPTNMMRVGSQNDQNSFEENFSQDNDYDSEYEIENDDKEIVENYLTGDGEYVGHYKVGNPYEIFGVKYLPQKYNDFEEVGISSWYGDAFDGKKTANGEVYHKGDMTAAHPTLPLPSMVLVTNLENGKSIKLRVNDRGPFAKKRIADVSERAAIELGFKHQGTTTIKLEFLKQDTEDMLRQLGIAQ
ncbi:MAG: rare lipoprotein A (peptidoglycan hydrolase) [Rickettsiales bacterium]|jgi:rare lipoprotein A (peptidoglycan hydrolase)